MRLREKKEIERTGEKESQGNDIIYRHRESPQIKAVETQRQGSGDGEKIGTEAAPGGQEWRAEIRESRERGGIEKGRDRDREREKE